MTVWATIPIWAKSNFQALFGHDPIPDRLITSWLLVAEFLRKHKNVAGSVGLLSSPVFNLL
jgi:hypothetical protein